MQVVRVTLQGSGICNEDALVEHPSGAIFGVVDGITPLVPWRSAEGATSGAVAAAVVKEYIERCPPEMPLRQMLAGANRALRAVMQEAGVDLSVPGSHWGCAAALVRVGPEGADFCHAGDCLIYAVYRGGEVRELTRDSVAPFDARLLQAYRRGEASPDQMKQMVRANRALANRPGGYTVVNGDPALEPLLEYGHINLLGLDALLLVSDGLTWPFPEPAEPPHVLMVREVLTRGLAEYAAYVRELEDGDPDRIRLPRLKHADDKTGILIRL